MEGLRRRFPWWPSSKESACNAEATGEKDSVSELRRSPRGGHGNPLQYSCLENPMPEILIFLPNTELKIPVFLPGEFHGQMRLAGYSHKVVKIQT